MTPFGTRTNAPVSAAYTPTADQSIAVWKSKATLPAGALADAATMTMQMLATSIDQTATLQLVSPVISFQATDAKGAIPRTAMMKSLSVATIVDRFVDQQHTVVLLITDPGLSTQQQLMIYPADLTFATQADQSRLVTFTTRNMNFQFAVAESATGTVEAPYARFDAIPPDSSGLSAATDVADEASQVDLSWTPGAGSRTGYKLQVSSSPITTTNCAGGAMVDNATLRSTRTTFPVQVSTDALTVTGLPDDSTAYFQLCSTNALQPPDVSPGINFKYPLPTRAKAVLSGVPANPSKATSLAVTVGDSTLQQYQYVVVSGAKASCTGATYSSWTSIATPITDPVSGDGPRLLCVLGLSAANDVQVTPTTYSWVVDQTPPTAPAGLVASNAAGGVALSYSDAATVYFNWNATSDNTGGSGIGSNTVSYYTTGDCTGTATNVTALAAAATSTSITGTDGTTYSFTVTAIDKAGNTTTSSCANPLLVDLTPPDAPTGLQTTQTYSSSTTVTASWAATSDNAGGSGVGSNTVSWYTDGACTSAAPSGTQSGLSANATSSVWSSAVNGTNYWYTVTAVDKAGNSRTSACSSGSILVDTTTPNAPAGLISSTEYQDTLPLDATWSATSTSGASGIQSNQVKWYSNAACSASVTVNATVGAAVTSDNTFAGTNGSTYYYTVTTTSKAGKSATSACSAGIMVDTVTPNTPAGLISSTHYQSTLPLNGTWSATSTSGISGIGSNQVKWYSDVGCVTLVNGDAAVGAAATSDNSYSGSNGNAYYYTVTTTSKAGKSATSACSSGSLVVDTTTPNTPSGLISSTQYQSALPLDATWSATGTTGASGIQSNQVKWYSDLGCSVLVNANATVAAAATSDSSFSGTNGHTYYYTVTATSGAGKSATSACSAGTVVDTMTPNTPGGLVSSTQYQSTLPLNATWSTTSTPGISGIQSNQVTWYSDAGCGTLANTDAAVAAAATSDNSYSGSNGDTYYYTVTTTSKAGESATSSCSAGIEVDTVTPNTPVGLISSTQYQSALPLNATWSATSTSGISGIGSNQVKWYTDAGCGTLANTDAAVGAATTADNSYSGSNGHTYYYTVTTTSKAGKSAASSCSAGTVVDTAAPNAPTGLISSTQYQSTTPLDATWSTTGTSGASGIQDNQVKWYSDSNCSTLVNADAAVAAGATSDNSFSGSNGNTYYYTVTASSNAGLSTTSACSVGIVVDTTAPSTPTGLINAQTYFNTTTASGTWTATSTSGASGIGSNTVKWYSNPGCTTLLVTNTGLSAGTTSNNYTGSNGGSYYYTVTAVSRAGLSSPASACSAALTVDTTTPTTPTGLISSTQYQSTTPLNATWSATGTSGVSGIQNNQVKWYSNSNCSTLVNADTAVAAGATSDNSFSGSNGNTYYYTVTATSNAGLSATSACSASIVVDTTTPNVPTGLNSSSTYINTTTLNATWSSTSTSGISGIASNQVKWYSDPGCTSLVNSNAAVSAAATSDNGYTGSNNHTYYYTVTTTSKAGLSAASACSSSITVDTNFPPALSTFSGAACCASNPKRANSVELTVTYPGNVSEYSTLQIYRVGGTTAPGSCGTGVLVTTYSSFTAGATVHYTDEAGSAGYVVSYLACLTGPSGNVTSSNTATNIASSNFQWLFATSTTYTGNLGGLSGANADCQTAGDAVDNALTWTALLSSGAFNAGSAPVSAGGVYNTASTPAQIFTGVTNMWSGGAMTNLPDYDETGASVTTNTSAWLGTTTTGVVDAVNDCSSWGATSGNGLTGVVDNTSTYFDGGAAACAGSARLYCISQPLPVTSFAAAKGSVTGGDVVLTTVMAGTTGLGQVKFYRQLGDVPPACGGGTAVTGCTISTPAAGTTTCTDATGIPFAYFSYAACFYEASNTSVIASAAGHARGYSSTAGHSLFVTSTAYAGAAFNGGGLAGADTTCANAAAALDPGNTAAWKAFMSTSTVNAISRMPLTANVYNIHGDEITAQATGLGNNAVTNAVKYDETGGTSVTAAWAGSQSNGNYKGGQSCSDWTSSASGSTGEFGDPQNNNNQWLDKNHQNCNVSASLYCISSAY